MFILGFVKKHLKERIYSHPRLVKAFGIIYRIAYIITPAAFVFMIELASNMNPGTLRVPSVLFSILICALIMLIFSGFTPSPTWGLYVAYGLAITFAVTNYCLLYARDIPFMLMDMRDIGTAAQVADDYTLSPDLRVYLSVLFGIIMMIIIRFFASYYLDTIENKRKFYLKRAICGVCSAGALLIIILFVSIPNLLDMSLNLWRPGNTYAKDTAVTSFIAYAQFSAIQKPKNYNKTEVEQLLRNAEENYDKKYGDLENDTKPIIISIMNEAFSDLSVLGPLESTKNDLSYFYSLKNDPGTIWHGYTYVSTHGGGTARSEFEWLTGYTMSLFPSAQPYSQFNFKKAATAVASIKANGYDAIAMHPEKATNYRRNTVYPQMGFDAYLSKEVYSGYDQVPFIENRISDKGDFELLTDTELDPNKPAFIHNVTMQNHGGYNHKITGVEPAKVDEKYSNVKDLVTYETLISMTDSALEELITYYKSYDRPVIISFYGDHLPKMPDTFLKDIESDGFDPTASETEMAERRYKVPCFIWANYEMENHIPGYAKGDGKLITSNNYLGAVTRADAGLSLSAFDKYLLLLREDIPVINASGYVAGGEWHSHDEVTEYSPLIEQYMQIQYAGLFDNSGLTELFVSQ